MIMLQVQRPYTSPCHWRKPLCSPDIPHAEVEEGGETTVPLAVAIEGAQPLANPSPCADRGGISVRPKKGDALLFFDMGLDGSTEDLATLHASCPTLKGTKWTATKWIHPKIYGGQYDTATAIGCRDMADDCSGRARAGECEREGMDMVGPGGLCRKTCKDCTAHCEPGDILCNRRNLQGMRHAVEPGN